MTMTNPNYWTAIGLLVDIVGVYFLASDLFKRHIREWIDDPERAFLDANERMSQSVIDMNEALPRDVYSNEKVAALVNKTRAYYAARATEFREQMADERKKQAVQVVTLNGEALYSSRRDSCCN
jgi:hypothetical protein